MDTVGEERKGKVAHWTLKENKERERERRVLYLRCEFERRIMFSKKVF